MKLSAPRESLVVEYDNISLSVCIYINMHFLELPCTDPVYELEMDTMKNQDLCLHKCKSNIWLICVFLNPSVKSQFRSLCIQIIIFNTGSSMHDLHENCM